MSFIKPSDVDLNNLILPTALRTSGMPGFKYCHHTNSMEYITHSIDRFYIPSREEYSTLKYPFPQPTDLALILSFAEVDKNGCIPIILRDKDESVYNQAITSTSFRDSRVIHSDSLGFPIMMNWDIAEAEKVMYEDNANFLHIKTQNYTYDKYYKYIIFGRFPQSYVGDKLNDELLHKFVNGALKKPLFDDKGNPIEFKIPYKKSVYCIDSDGQEYLLVSDITFRKNVKLKNCDGNTIKVKQHMFFKIEPIMWQILNNDELPLTLGGNALHSKTNKVRLISKNTLLTGLDVYMKSWTDESSDGTKFDNNIRNYLCNYFPITAFGRNLPPISYGQVENALTDIGANIKNSNISVPVSKDVRDKISAQKEYNDAASPTSTASADKEYLDENGQLTPEFIEKLKAIEEKHLGVKKNKEETMNTNLTIIDKELTIDEQIAHYINCGASFMLHGLSGIGKSSRVQNINPDLFVGISLSDGMLPEEIKGKTLYPVGQASYWEPPHWYTRINEMCEKNPDKKIVLFIDELTNVDPHVQDLVFDLIQYKSIAPNQGKLPDNCVVVAAGNDKEDSSAAYSLAEPLFRKFSAHIYIPLSVEEFIKYGTKPHRDGSPRPQIHPLITAFVASYGKKVLHSQYDRDNPPKYAIDPRGWEQLSNLIYACDNKIIKSLFENKLGSNLTASFIEFAKTPLITPKDILSGKSIKVPYDINKQLAIALSLRTVNKQQLPFVLSFIAENMHKEVLQTFITEWSDNDTERLLFANNIIQQKIKTSAPIAENTGQKTKSGKNDNITPNQPTEDEVFETSNENSKMITDPKTGAIRPSSEAITDYIEKKRQDGSTTPEPEGDDKKIIPTKTHSAFARWWSMKNEDIDSEPIIENSPTDESEDASYWINKSIDNSKTR